MTRNQPNLVNVTLDLPRRRFSVLSHLDNIDYCIEKIESHPSTDGSRYVVGYNRERALGTRQVDYRLLSEQYAQRVKIQNPNFDYITLDDLLKMKEEINRGRYKIRNGLVIDSSTPESARTD